MTGGRRAALAVWLALGFHGSLIAAGLYRYSYDAATHEFFADHYARSPFGLWDPRWFAGFSVSSYPPLAHQLIALVASPLSYDAAFGVVLLATLLLLPLAVWRFAGIFVSGPAAGAAAIVSVFVPAVALTADAFGQLPTLVSLVIALFAVSEWSRYIERGGARRFALAVALFGACATAHHATPVLFLPPAMLAAFAVIARRDPMRIRRAFLVTSASAAVAVIALLPLAMWMREAPAQVAIPHLSRASFLLAADAQALFGWSMYGVLPAIALFGLRIAGRSALPSAVLALVFAVVGLGGTTAVPSLLFGAGWEWLTYDRFALWGAIALLPIAGVGFDHVLARRSVAMRAAFALGMAVLACMSVVTASSSQLMVLPYMRDLGPVAAFLNTDGHDRWRYQTFGFGEPSVALGYLTSATTIDGAYFTARAVPELTESGIGMIDYALWWDPSGEALRRVLARADDDRVRWGFVAEPGYEPYLAAAGYRPLTTLDGGVAVWEKPDVPPLPESARRFGDVDALGVLWGTLPLTLSALVLAFGFAQYRPIRVARGGRAVRRWREGRSLVPLSR